MRLFFFGLCLVFATGCDAADPMDEIDNSFMGLAAASTGDAATPYVFVHESGETMAVEVDATGDSVRRVALTGPDGTEVVVTLAPDGTPTRMTAGGVVVVFGNVRASLADLVVITPDGESQVARDVPFDAAALRASADGLSKSGQAPGLAEAAGFAGLALGITGCTVTTVVAAGTVVILGPAAVAVSASAALGCVGALVGVLALHRQLNGTSSPELEATNSAFGAVGGVVSAIQCAGANVRACIEAVLALTSGAFTRGEITEAQRQAIIERAEALLQGGGGDVQVSLSWDTSADLDLWVTDPAGERIYYANSSSASGGQLDLDDTDGFGPENVFWATGAAPAGSYTVQVDHFSGASPSSYRVQTVIGGAVRSFTGTVSSDQTDTVTTFTVTGAGPALPAPREARADWNLPPKGASAVRPGAATL